MKRRSFIQSLAGASLLSQAGARVPFANTSTKKTNIVLILADDMGFSDPQCFGGEIRTPNINSLAETGTRFTNFYNCARCCPTRASLMTGLYPHQVGLSRNGQNLTHDGATIAEVLRSANYNTAMVGKWHLSQTKPLDDGALHQKWLDHQYDPGQPFAPIDTYPINRGFDRYYGNIWGVVDYFDPFSLVEGTNAVPEVPDDFYMTDAITKKSVEYINALSQSDKPFFMYIAHCAPHWPLHALEEDIARYRGVFKDGWDELRKKRYERLLKLGLFDEKNTPLPPVQDGGKHWDDLSEEEKRYQSEKMAVHAAMVDRLDQGIGNVVQALKDNGQWENTLLIFLADNGASPEIPTEPGYDRSSQTREGEKIHYQGEITHPGPETTYTGIGPAWANAANTPFRYWKAQSFEGGCHTPLIVHWPETMQYKQGTVSHEMGHVIDIMPTCLEIAGADYPETYEGHRLLPLEGESLLPVSFGEKDKNNDRTLYFEHERGRAIREGDWKLVANKNTPQKWELYHLADDLTETNNLAQQEPDRVKRMSDKWRAWANRVGAIN
ncbi:MAG: sulfatase-like hydrolase/transferase [bacterium]|nr:sulfatase-like hydrolase/transferase [bacterium]